MAAASGSGVDSSSACWGVPGAVLVALPWLGSRRSARCGEAHRGTALVQTRFFNRVSSWPGFPRVCLAPSIQGEAVTTRGGGTGGRGMNQLHWHSCLKKRLQSYGSSLYCVRDLHCGAMMFLAWHSHPAPALNMLSCCDPSS